MLTESGLLAWYTKLVLPARARAVIDHIRSSEPARRVGGYCRNVSGRYPSRKMGVTIQFESHRVELAAVYEFEHDPDVLEYFDQPPPFKLDYESLNGRHLGVLHTADYFVIRRGSAGWEECKTEEELVELNRKSPNRYTRDGEGRWACPPGEAYATVLSLYYRVRSTREIDWVFQRNIQFLEDYLRAETPYTSQTRELVLAHVGATPGISLAQLFEATAGTVSRDDIYSLIASSAFHVDLHSAPLAEPASVRVFTNGPAGPSDSRLNLEKTASPALAAKKFSAGSRVTWDGKEWKILNVGDTTISLLDHDQTFVEAPWEAIDAAVKAGRILVTSSERPSRDSVVWKRLASAAERELRIANDRLSRVTSFLAGIRPVAEAGVPKRTLRRWAALYRRAENELGSGFLGLLPQPPAGNSSPKLPEATRKRMNEFIASDYESLKQKSRYASWIAFKLACEKEGLVAPSLKTFSLAIQQRAGYDQTFKRRGPRAAYTQEDFYWELEPTTPRHGDRPFEIAHIDHTELDVEAVCSRAGQVLGRPWMTLLTDAFSRRVLALHLTFDPPSYRSCMMALRECVRRHSRLPQIMVVDGGRDFQSVYFETLLARYECTKKTRPAAKPRFGSVCERLFGTANTQFIHNLKGNTQITRLARQVTQSVNPKGQAVWPFEELHRRLTEYVYEVYETLHHPALGQSPREAYEAGMARTGLRAHRAIAYDREFLVHTLPTTPKGTAMIRPGRGVKIRGVYYWSDAFRDPGVAKKPAGVRYDPFDAGTAYAYVGKEWMECHSEYFSILHGRSEKEMMLATQELRRLNQRHAGEFTVTARRLAEFLESVEAEERVLQQRLTDAEVRRVAPTITAIKESSAPPLQEPISVSGPDSETEVESRNHRIYGSL